MENQPESTFSDETFEDIRVSAKWMNTIGILSVIVGILGVLGDLVNISTTPTPAVFLGLLTSGFGIYIAFILISKATSMKNLADQKDSAALAASLVATKKYWMLSVMLIIISFVIQQVVK